jgi:hypothetical protein
VIDPSVRGQDEVDAADAAEIRQVFVTRVHQVLQEGYNRLDAAAHSGTPEPAITGRLVEAMESFLNDAVAPDWAEYFSVHDDPPVNDGKRFGKDRNRIDIKVRASRPRPGTIFSFEAKRLARGYTVSKYLGPEGLGCILCGTYARDEDEAGMIGYVQDDDAAYWAGEIKATIEADPVAHEVDAADWWKPHTFGNGPRHVFVSIHERKAVGRPVTIYHSLLIFTAAP